MDGLFVGTKSLSLAIKFVTFCAKNEWVMENLLKENLDTILYKVALPILLLSDEDMEMFVEQPVEFVLNPVDYIDSSLNPKRCMIDFINFVCTEYYPP
jgi:hypothetical protein